MSLSFRRLSAAFLAEFRASPAKGGVLVVGLALLVALLARLALREPEAADASAMPLVAASSPGGSDAGAAVALAEKPRPRTARPTLARTLRRDLFAAPWTQAPTGGSEAVEAPQEVKDLVLQFTLVDGSGPPRAVISGVMVKPGSRVGAYVVVRIDRRAVVLQDQVQEITLRMP